VRRRALLLAPALAFAAAAARAHDFWIEPSSFHPDPGSEIAVALRVGQDFRGEPVPRNPPLIQRFALLSGRTETPIDGLPGADPAGQLRIPAAGVYWIAFRSGRSSITLEGDKFEKYLSEEGLEAVSKTRGARGESAKPAHEVYSRSVKCLLVSGNPGASAKDFDRPLGLTLELIPRRDPGKAIPGPLPVALLYDGKPLPGALVVAMEQGSSADKVSARTDARGEATLKLPRKGVWLVKAVHMTPAPAGFGAEWESVWTSLTFEAR
jgi:uncharacterized GH25 family protein